MREFNWPCVHRGAPTGERVNCGCGIGPAPVYECANQFIPGGKCVIRKGARCGAEVAAMQSCASCNQWVQSPDFELPVSPAMKIEPPAGRVRIERPKPAPFDRLRPWVRSTTDGVVVLNANLHGYGDACVTAWIAEGSKGAAKRLVHYATGAKRDFLEMLGQEVTSDATGARNTFSAYSHELRESGDTPRVYQRARHLGIDATPRRPTARIADDDLQWAEEAIGHQKTVLLFPNTEYGSREWPAFYWLELAELLAAKGIPVVVGGGVVDRRYSDLPSYFGDPWPRTAALMRRAALVVGNDSGPAHVAGTLDVPTIALLGPSSPSMFVHVPSVRCLQVSKEMLACSGCYFHAPPFVPACESGCVALGHLRPGVVLEAILEALP